MPQQAAAAATPMAFARAVAWAYAQRSADPGGALQAARITPAQLAVAEGRITAAQWEQLCAAAMSELDDEGLGAFERRLPWGSYGLLARGSLSAPTLGVALKRWCRHHGLLTERLRLELAVAGGSCAISVQELQPLSAPVRELMLAFILRNVHGLACWFIDSRIPLQGATLPFEAPPHAAAYGLMFRDGPLQFGAARAGIRFDAAYLALPLRRDEKAMAAMLQRALPIPVLQYRRDRLLVQQVRQVLATQPGLSHSADAIAGALHLSARTLHRQLKDEGASLQQLKDEVRCEQARELLLRTGRPIKQVAAAVGFRNEKSFTRAFREWTGSTPGAFRSEQGAAACAPQEP